MVPAIVTTIAPGIPDRVGWLRRWVPVTCGVLVVLIPAVGWAMQQLPYDTEYEVIEYSTATPTDPVARLQQKLNDGDVELQFDGESGYLASLLRQLKISVASQMLVFSKTSFRTSLISSQTPRAIYFNDNVYVAWEQNSPVVEISSFDPRLGPVFYTLNQKLSKRPRFKRETHLCLRCHDSYSLTGGGVPRYILGSGFADKSGRLVSHEGWHLTTDQTPLNQRWGGWYVTGTHGDQVHMGNLIPENAVDAARMDLHTGKGPLAQHLELVAVLALPLHVIVGGQKETARTTGRVANGLADPWVDTLNDSLDHWAGREVLPRAGFHLRGVLLK